MDERAVKILDDLLMGLKDTRVEQVSLEDAIAYLMEAARSGMDVRFFKAMAEEGLLT